MDVGHLGHWFNPHTRTFTSLANTSAGSS
jgi:hypothetical protein